MNFYINDIVRLKSFFGTTTKDDDIQDNEDYWKLIGLSGKIINVRENPHSAFPDKGLQVLVHFFKDLDNYNLICHNSEKNSLWIFETDLDLDQ